MNYFLLHSSWLILFYGLMGALLTLPWSLGIIKRTGPRPAAYLNLLMTVLSFVHGTIAFSLIWQGKTEQLVFKWLSVADLDL